MTWTPDRLNRLREDARMMRIYHDDHGIQEVIELCDAFEQQQAELCSQWIVMKDALDSLNEGAPETTTELLQQQLVLSIDHAPEEVTT